MSVLVESVLVENMQVETDVTRGAGEQRGDFDAARHVPPAPAADSAIRNPQSAIETPFFAVSLTKLALLSVLTCGVYQYYWLYQQWQAIKRRDDADISPFWRTFFSIVYLLPLLRALKAAAARAGVPARFSPVLLFVAFNALSLAGLVPNAVWLVGLLAFVPLIIAQRAANAVNARLAPAHDRNARFSAANLAAALLGGLITAVAVVGTLLGLA
ncbi:MAG TPA: DUF4234 domain-containing protein [Pyrinomonadaceae bacterium]|jgi:hypothetical protein